MLDVATGAGYVAALAKRRGAQPVGLDFSEAQVKLARSTYPDVEFRRGDAQALPFEAEIFDAVAIGFVLNHLPEPEQAFREAFRVLRSGGRMAFTVWAAPKQGEGFGSYSEPSQSMECPTEPASSPAVLPLRRRGGNPPCLRERGVYRIGHEHHAAVLVALHAGRGLRSFQRRRGPSNRNASCSTARPPTGDPAHR